MASTPAFRSRTAQIRRRLASEIELLDRLRSAERIPGRSSTFPNGIGFCLYVPRECLDAVRELSNDFYRDYLEDVDFCLRAAKPVSAMCASRRSLSAARARARSSAKSARS